MLCRLLYLFLEGLRLLYRLGLFKYFGLLHRRSCFPLVVDALIKPHIVGELIGLHLFMMLVLVAIGLADH